MYDTILVPTDGSEATVDVLEHALDLADRHDATIHAMYVIDESNYYSLPEDRQAEAEETLERKAERAVEEVEMHAAEVGVDCERHIRTGAPDEVIVQHASGNDVDVIVMGTHGYADRSRFVKIGSVTERVARNADVPVFVVHIDDDTTM
jgi:nucleotide-binding universal stress UspA family protein